MATDNPFMLTLATFPSRRHQANSIIAIKGKRPPPMRGWRRKIHQRHVDYAESEYIVRSGHSSR